ncbi:hypothetical protein ACOSQ2_018993 [Xanthoceras sorbifolium]
MALQGTMKLGPWGGTGGSDWSYNPGSGSALKEIVINHGRVVDSISFKSIDQGKNYERRIYIRHTILLSPVQLLNFGTNLLNEKRNIKVEFKNFQASKASLNL